MCGSPSPRPAQLRKARCRTLVTERMRQTSKSGLTLCFGTSCDGAHLMAPLKNDYRQRSLKGGRTAQLLTLATNTVRTSKETKEAYSVSPSRPFPYGCALIAAAEALQQTERTAGRGGHQFRKQGTQKWWRLRESRRYCVALWAILDRLGRSRRAIGTTSGW